MIIVDEVSKILTKISGIEKVKADDTLQSDLALDSLSMITILIEIEDLFHIELDEADISIDNLTTVQDVINLVNKYCGDKNE